MRDLWNWLTAGILTNGKQNDSFEGFGAEAHGAVGAPPTLTKPTYGNVGEFKNGKTVGVVTVYTETAIAVGAEGYGAYQALRAYQALSVYGLVTKGAVIARELDAPPANTVLQNIKGPNWGRYSVAFQTQLQSSSYPGVSRQHTSKKPMKTC